MPSRAPVPAPGAGAARPAVAHGPWARRAPPGWRCAALLWFLAGAGGLCAEEEPPAPEEAAPGEAAPAEPPALRDATDAEAKPLVEALKKAERKKDPAEVAPALDAIAEVHHPDFEKSLLKLLGHESSLVAGRVAQMWEGRVRDPKAAGRLWKAAWGDKKNDKRFGVKGKVVRALGRAGIALDKRQYEDLERDWRWMIGNPGETFGEALVDMAAYFELTRDKRHCRWLAEELDEPMATNPNSPSNPPAEWWERRHKMWRPVKPAVVAALKAITGQEFDKTAQAKAWFEANERTFGFRW